MEKIFDHEFVNSFIEGELASWPLAKANYDALAKIRRRNMSIYDMDVAIQCNPARIRSTGAVLDKKVIENRPCILCAANRPKEQTPVAILGGWKMLLNPYPIFPVHLTIVSDTHQPQENITLDVIGIAEKLPGMVVFFNGSKAGASIPEHFHLQAVLKDELPLIRAVEKLCDSKESKVVYSPNLGGKFPFFFITGVIRKDKQGASAFMTAMMSGGLDEDGMLSDPELSNKFFWIDSNGVLRFLVIPRKAHRPSSYFAEGADNRMISPGCIDMAGVIITARESDFEALTEKEVRTIFEEVGISPDVIE